MGTQKSVRARVPASTYRLQFNAAFTFEQAAALVAYLDELGVSDCYSSPVLKARAGSVHGYDIVDHTRLNPEVGTEEEFARFAHEVRRHGMGLVMDVVPNHMCIGGSDNRWWLDLLENGPGSSYARFFDVDWNPPNPALKNKVLLPILGDQYGRVLENQEIKIVYRGGAFFATYYETTLPVAARTSTLLLELALARLKQSLGDYHTDVLEMESIITALRHLPPRTELDAARVRERRREKEVSKRRLATLVKQSKDARKAVHEALIEINGTRGEPASFDHLERLLDEQAYRLSYWRVASDEINYRRFFDINELAAVRVEERPVFTAVHEVLFRLMKQGLVTGLRIDHVDGLFDPEKYLADVQRACAAALSHARPHEAEDDARARDEEAADGLPCYVVVEKILGHDELLRREWAVHGTTGYDFMSLLNGIFVEHRHALALRALYGDFTGSHVSFADLLYECKSLILQVAMSSELHVLARRLERISEQHRFSRDFTFNSLLDALREVIACFPVYRTYVRRKSASVSPDDRLHINAALRAAKRRNAAVSESIFDFVASVLLLEDPQGLTAAQVAERRDFVMRFQQLTGPVTAKGLEDTGFYRFYPLASLNEVGGEPAIFGTPLERFHRRNHDRQQAWPHTLNATATHDTKRGEDTRTRIDVLSEIPEEWTRALHRWREMNRPRKGSAEGREVPDANEEYLLYQTLVGTWPLAPLNEEEQTDYTRRVVDYMNKALKEAKVHTSWISPNEAYDTAVREFVEALLAPGADNEFLKDFVEFQRTTARAGLFNSLSQVLVKTCAPGVPDFYQGTELWSFTLVDPDNRRPVDYELRRRLLASLREEEEVRGATALVKNLVGEPEDGRVKLFLTSRALRFRRERRELFAQGEYVALAATGRRADNVVAFARRRGEQTAIAVAARLFISLGAARGVSPVGAEVWEETELTLPETIAHGRYRDVFTGAEFETGAGSLRLAEVFAHMPVALLERV
jgi:(1->4)-alpha-D-glucan 1-alpha-D-glucosylmutase